MGFSTHIFSLLLHWQVIEDLEWPGGCVTIHMQRSPPAVRFRSSGNCALEVELLVDELGSFSCGQEEVKFNYR